MDLLVGSFALRVGLPFFPDFQLPGKQKIFGIPAITWDSENLRDSGKFAGKYFELDYLATREVTKTFFLISAFFLSNSKHFFVVVLMN